MVLVCRYNSWCNSCKIKQNHARKNQQERLKHEISSDGKNASLAEDETFAIFSLKERAAD